MDRNVIVRELQSYKYNPCIEEEKTHHNSFNPTKKSKSRHTHDQKIRMASKVMSFMLTPSVGNQSSSPAQSLTELIQVYIFVIQKIII